jgi:hypothetical protein
MLKKIVYSTNLCSKMVSFTTAQTDGDLEKILALQQQNLYKNIDSDTQALQGFVTVEHTFELLKQMNEAIPQIIAKDAESVIGYALVMPVSFGDMIPELRPMFSVFNALAWRERSFKDVAFYVMGQICVAESHRSMGVFDGLYEAHRRFLGTKFELCVTEVAVRNTRSMRAHERVGFETIHTYNDHLDRWNVIAWDWA